MSLESELRRAADEFVLAVAVVADERGNDPAELAEQALADSLARLTESGALGRGDDEDDDEAAG